MAALCVLMYMCVWRLYNLNYMFSIATGRLMQCSTHISKGSMKYRTTIHHFLPDAFFHKDKQLMSGLFF